MITPLTEAHIGDVAEIERLCFSDPWSRSALLESLRSPFSLFYVFEEGGKAAGYMGMYAVSGEGSVTNVAVHPEHRCRGIGRALVENAISVGRENGLEYMTLEVRASNHTAQSLYKKCGFENAGTRKSFYSHPKEDAVIMNYYFEKD